MLWRPQTGNRTVSSGSRSYSLTVPSVPFFGSYVNYPAPCWAKSLKGPHRLDAEPAVRIWRARGDSVEPPLSSTRGSSSNGAEFSRARGNHRLRPKGATSWRAVPLPLLVRSTQHARVTRIGLIRQPVVALPDAVIVAAGPAVVLARASRAQRRLPCIARGMQGSRLSG